MSFLDSALSLAEQGFHVFPVITGGKLPAIDDFPNRATRDAVLIRKWWIDPVLELEQPYNIGISTSRFGSDEALVVIDVDNKPGKDGDGELLKLEIEGFDFPETFQQETPTGGRHLVYRVKDSLKQGANVLGQGIDVRSRGGYIVGAGSQIEEKFYQRVSRSIPAPAPSWLSTRLQKAVERERVEKSVTGLDLQRAIKRARHYLEQEAPLARENSAGDQTSFAVAARLKDFGVSREACLTLLLDHWNDRCEPPWLPADLEKKVENAYTYGHEPKGVAAPEVQFDTEALEQNAPNPFSVFNREYAFVVAGGGSHILWETVDHKSCFKLEHLGLPAFHQKHAAETLQVGNANRPITELWMKSPQRRSYDGICFMPGLKSPARFYNLWRGFSVEPLLPGEVPTEKMTRALKMFLDHARENVCRGDNELYSWLIGYFAQLIQKPWEKPLVALVFRGGKGTGKNALIERVGQLIANHFMVTSDKRYLTGNFNGHLENLLLFALDEAFWSGDKQAEGVLKNLITGKTHNIEHKGKEPYNVDNCTRVIIIGNEEWLVPATQDERRFAVFDVGDGRKQDTVFFREMRELMEDGGYQLLLRYLLDFDFTGIDVNIAPSTEALKDQKILSLNVFHQFWHTCLEEGRIAYADFDGGVWQTEVDRDRLRDAFSRYFKSRHISGRVPDERSIGKLLRDVCKGVSDGTRRSECGGRARTYRLPVLSESRRQWDLFIGHASRWAPEDK